MELNLKTTELQEIVGKVSKCVSNNKLIPLTSLMSVKVSDKVLTFTTTDATNYYYVSKAGTIECEDFEVSVIADLFTKLVQKTTSDEISLVVESGIMKVKGNGTYTMELPLDENGSAIKFPNKLDTDMPLPGAGTVKTDTVKNILAVNKASLAENMDFPALTCYYCGDTVITSDRKRVCRNDVKVFEKPMLVSNATMELLGVFSGNDITVSASDDIVIFSSSTDKLYTPVTSGIETFPVAGINKLVDQDFKSTCKISKNAILNVLDRLALFVSPYDHKGIHLTFTQEGVMLSSLKSSGTELIPYISSENFEAFTCCINIEMLRSQIATHSGDELTMSYGSNVAIKLSENNITQIIALLDNVQEEK